MRLLLDENISWRLAKLLAPHFGAVDHVDQTNLFPSPSDFEIWQFAKEHQYHILTKDEDFSFLVAVYGSPPKVIRLRNAQVAAGELYSRLAPHLDGVRAFLLSEDASLLEIHL